MSYEPIVWASLNILALWYSLYLGKKGLSFLTNIVPLSEKLEKKLQEVRTQEELDKLQNILHAAQKTGRVGLIYLCLGLVGTVGLIVLNTMYLMGE